MTTTQFGGRQIPAQGPVGADGLLLHEGDHVAQLALALENLEQALADAGLATTDLVELRVRTADRRLFDDASEVLADRLTEHGICPTITVTEVSRLEQPGMTVTVQPITACPITSHKGETSMTIDFTRTSCPIHLPGDAGYDQARTPWAVQVDQRPAAVAVPRTAAEVVEAVLAAIDAGLRIAPQSSATAPARSPPPTCPTSC